MMFLIRCDEIHLLITFGKAFWDMFPEVMLRGTILTVPEVPCVRCPGQVSQNIILHDQQLARLLVV